VQQESAMPLDKPSMARYTITRGVGIFAGYLELMMRERAGLPKPAAGRNWFG
jgi:hypothetical protein